MTIDSLEFWIKHLVAAGASSKIAADCIGKMEKATVKYGEYQATTDTRNFTEEMREELKDAANYALMAIERGDNIKLNKDLLKKYVEIIELLETHG